MWLLELHLKHESQSNPSVLWEERELSQGHTHVTVELAGSVLVSWFWQHVPERLSVRAAQGVLGRCQDTEHLPSGTATASLCLPRRRRAQGEERSPPLAGACNGAENMSFRKGSQLARPGGHFQGGSSAGVREAHCQGSGKVSWGPHSKGSVLEKQGLSRPFPHPFLLHKQCLPCMRKTTNSCPLETGDLQLC